MHEGSAYAFLLVLVICAAAQDKKKKKGWSTDVLVSDCPALRHCTSQYSEKFKKGMQFFSPAICTDFLLVCSHLRSISAPNRARK